MSAGVALPRVPGFQILRRIGSGGLGALFEAVRIGPRGFEDAVVLEQIGGDGRLDRTGRRLLHPNIARTDDLLDLDDRYLVMEMLRGRIAADVLGPPVPWWMVVEIALQALAGLEHAHQHGVEHGALTLASLFLSADGTVKILDLGIASTKRSGEDLLQLAAALRPLLGDDAPEAVVRCLSQAFDSPRLMRKALEPLAEEATARGPEAIASHLARFAPAREGPRASAALLPGPSRFGTIALVLLALSAVAIGAGSGLLFSHPISMAPKAETSDQPRFTRLTERRGEIVSARFEADGAHVVYTAAWDGAAAATFLAEPDGGGVRRLERADPQRESRRSPNGTQAAAIHDDRVVTIDLATKVETALTEPMSGVRTPVWRGEALLFARGGELWAVGPDQPPEMILRTIGDLRIEDVGPEGSVLVADGETTHTITLIGPEPEQRRVDLFESDETFLTDISGDGRSVLLGDHARVRAIGGAPSLSRSRPPGRALR